MSSAAVRNDGAGSLGSRLRSLRERADLSARELDRLAGRAEGHANRIETMPAVGVNVETISSYSRVLGCSLDWLVSGAGHCPADKELRKAVDAADAAWRAAQAEG